MKRTFFMWLFIFIVTVVYMATLFFVRLKNPEHIQQEAFSRWRSAYIVKKNNDQTFVNTSNDRQNPVALSEGQGYGLQIMARAGEKGWASRQDFDHLLNYYLAHRDRVGDHHDQLTFLMSWRQAAGRHGKWVSEQNSATDGDLYIAAALNRAAKVWPQQAAKYHRLESQIAADILRYEYNPDTGTLTVGDWVNKRSDYYYLMRTSDVMPVIFDKMYQENHDSRWLTVKNKMLDRLVDLSNQHKSGLVPDFAWVSKDNARPVKPRTVASKYDGDYYYNACRVPMMLANCHDQRGQKVLTKMMKFFSNQYYITAGYSLRGDRLTKYQSNSFGAPIFYAVSCNRGKGYDNLFASQKFIFSKPLTKKNYYDATLTTLAALEGMN